ncbi:hypothetical protein [Arthrobacter alpinus]|uniref:hypothetical protein n=1 Tax=Arthrobacter alpinus TaxID=656366 RepID=UPI001646EEBB|nr:hypothetical protein [Arthrobacter alpinus]
MTSFIPDDSPTYSPVANGEIRQVIYLDDVTQKVNLPDGVSLMQDGRMLLGFHPDTKRPIYLEESVALPALPEGPE